LYGIKQNEVQKRGVSLKSQSCHTGHCRHGEGEGEGGGGGGLVGALGERVAVVEGSVCLGELARGHRLLAHALAGRSNTDGLAGSGAGGEVGGAEEGAVVVVARLGRAVGEHGGLVYVLPEYLLDRKVKFRGISISVNVDSIVCLLIAEFEGPGSLAHGRGRGRGRAVLAVSNVHISTGVPVILVRNHPEQAKSAGGGAGEGRGDGEGLVVEDEAVGGREIVEGLHREVGITGSRGSGIKVTSDVRAAITSNQVPSDRDCFASSPCCRGGGVRRERGHTTGVGGGGVGVEGGG